MPDGGVLQLKTTAGGAARLKLETRLRPSTTRDDCQLVPTSEPSDHRRAEKCDAKCRSTHVQAGQQGSAAGFPSSCQPHCSRLSCGRGGGLYLSAVRSLNAAGCLARLAARMALSQLRLLATHDGGAPGRALGAVDAHHRGPLQLRSAGRTVSAQSQADPIRRTPACQGRCCSRAATAGAERASTCCGVALDMECRPRGLVQVTGPPDMTFWPFSLSRCALVRAMLLRGGGAGVLLCLISTLCGHSTSCQAAMGRPSACQGAWLATHQLTLWAFPLDQMRGHTQLSRMLSSELLSTGGSWLSGARGQLSL